VKHMQLRRFERFLRPYLKSVDHADVETTCLYRNPIDWLGSWYRYRQRDALIGHKNSTADKSFEDFVLSYLSEHLELSQTTRSRLENKLSRDFEIFESLGVN